MIINTTDIRLQTLAFERALETLETEIETLETEMDAYAEDSIPEELFETRTRKETQAAAVKALIRNLKDMIDDVEYLEETHFNG